MAGTRTSGGSRRVVGLWRWVFSRLPIVHFKTDICIPMCEVVGAGLWEGSFPLMEDMKVCTCSLAHGAAGTGLWMCPTEEMLSKS